MRVPTWTELITAVSALGAWITSWYASSKVREVHVLINSRLSALLKLTGDSSFEAGRKVEKDKRDQFLAGQQDQKRNDDEPKPG